MFWFCTYFQRVCPWIFNQGGHSVNICLDFLVINKLFDCSLQCFFIQLLIVKNCSNLLLLHNLSIHILFWSERQPQDRNSMVYGLLIWLRWWILPTWRLTMPTWEMSKIAGRQECDHREFDANFPGAIKSGPWGLETYFFLMKWQEWTTLLC